MKTRIYWFVINQRACRCRADRLEVRIWSMPCSDILARKKEPLYLAVIHRLDQPVEGILVFAKNKKSAAGLNKQMQDGKMDKYYLAVTSKYTGKKSGRLEDWMIKMQKRIRRELQKNLRQERRRQYWSIRC